MSPTPNPDKFLTQYGLRYGGMSPTDDDAFIEQSGNSQNPYGNDYFKAPLYLATLFDTEQEAQDLKTQLSAYVKFQHLEPEKLVVCSVRTPKTHLKGVLQGIVQGFLEG